MIALEIEASIINHRISATSGLLPARASHAKVIVMYEESSVEKDAVPDILALARGRASELSQTRCPRIAAGYARDAR